MEAGEVDFGPYGFGRARTLADYERYAGLNFRLRLVQPYTLRDDPPPNPEIYATDEEWIDGCVKDYWVRICVPPDAVDGEADYDFWYVGVHDRGRRRGRSPGPRPRADRPGAGTAAAPLHPSLPRRTEGVLVDRLAAQPQSRLAAEGSPARFRP